VVRVPNERDDAATTRVEVRFPETLTSVGFADVPGWDREVTMTELEEPVEVFGEEVTEAVGSVTWSGGRIEPGEFAEFPFSARVPEEEGALEFPALQTYDSGEVVRWIGPPDADEPAALVAPVDLGAGEEAGELQVLADVNRRVVELAQSDDAGDEDSGDMGVLLGSIGAGLGAVALLTVLFRRR
jgi:periplasmic copper chaperone A